MADLKSTTDIVSQDMLTEIIGMTSDEIDGQGSPIAVCAGEWRKEPDTDREWRFWKNPEFDEED